MQLKTYSHHKIVIHWLLYVCKQDNKAFPLPARLFLDPYTNFSGLLKINSRAINNRHFTHFFVKRKKNEHIVMIQRRF